MSARPLLVCHGDTGWSEPGDVFVVGAAHWPALEKPAAAEHRVAAAQFDQSRGECGQLGEGLGAFPVDPGQRVVLAVGVVVAILSAAEFITAEQHRHALGEEEGGQQVAFLPLPERQYRWVLRGAFDPAVPGPVVIAAVTVVLAVGLVVLGVVRDQVVQGESVVGGDEVDGGKGPPAAGLIQVTGTSQPGGELPDGAGSAAPKVPDSVAVAAVPLSPQRGKLPT